MYVRLLVFMEGKIFFFIIKGEFKREDIKYYMIVEFLKI